ncbi:hypothetical protein ACFSCX_20600 [Bacillus salitolerans]|uniref:FbpB family small basic protein n=1 Tax=Bacillus salitolerans TaxID=1437434 RepID=A0ABW4LUW2_9BACI
MSKKKLINKVVKKNIKLHMEVQEQEHQHELEEQLKWQKSIIKEEYIVSK